MRNKLMSMAWVVLIASPWLIVAPAAADDDNATPDRSVTFYRDVLPILQEKCQDCHRPSGANFSGMVAPMSLLTYQEVRPWAKSIAERVRAREMPPWDAAQEFHGIFLNERTLNDEQVETVVRWAQSGAQAGNPAEGPAPRVFPEIEGGWALGQPDLVVSIPEPFLLKDEINDLYITFFTDIPESDLAEDRFVKSVEFKPGPAVHHIISNVGGLAPGTDPTVYPEGFASVLRKGTQVRWQMHYHKEAGPGTAVVDETQVGIRFHPKEMKIRYTIEGSNIGNHTFEIPPAHAHWEVGAARIFEKDTFLYTLLPHMHLRGKAAEYVAIYPDNTRETLLVVPAYDFNWQTRYIYREPKFIPGGTRIEVRMWFDNSPERSRQFPEVDANKAVRFGGPTTDEMMLGWYSTITPVDPQDWAQPNLAAQVAARSNP